MTDTKFQKDDEVRIVEVPWSVNAEVNWFRSPWTIEEVSKVPLHNPQYCILGEWFPEHCLVLVSTAEGISSQRPLNKPVLDIKPKDIHTYLVTKERLIELLRGLQRYVEEDVQHDDDWTDELVELLGNRMLYTQTGR